MKFPVEIIELILLKCDGKTLRTAREVNDEWKEVINYLSEKTNIWKWCCLEEIPEKELIDYLDKNIETDRTKWQKIYDNWISWQNLVENIRYEVVYTPVEIPRISCIAASGQLIAVGSEDGRVRVFTEHWKPIYTARHKAVRVGAITFMDIGHGMGRSEFCMVISYPRALVVDHFNTGADLEPLILEDIKDHSVNKNYICYEKIRGRISIAKLTTSREKRLLEVWFSRIYSPSYPTCLNIWNGVCTLLINDEVQAIRYGAAESPPVAGLERLARLRSSIETSERTYRIVRDDIVISLCRADCFEREEFIEFFILGPKNQYSKKLFNTWEVLRAFITCIFVYGNTLVLGVDCGNVYFYHVSCWKHFDISNYKKKIIIGKHPIISIDVREVDNTRTFFVSSTFSVHEVRGYHLSNF